MASILKVDRILDSTELGTVDIPGGISIDGNRVSGIPGYNYIINGNFDIWQRGTSQTTSAYGSADRWACANVGTTKTASQQIFALGQTDVPGNPKYYMRHVVNSVSGVNNLCNINHKIEYVKTLAGKTATLSFWAKADTPKNIAIEFVQSFGTGGAPSSVVVGIGSQLVALTTSWQRFVVTTDIPSIAGKTLGTDGNDHLDTYFWFDAGSDYATRSADLGQQSGTFDIACVSLVEGAVDVKPIPRSYGEELALCQRYFWELASSRITGYTEAGSEISVPVIYPVTMRAIPFSTIRINFTLANVQNGYQPLITNPNITATSLRIVAGASGTVSAIDGVVTFDAEL